MPLAIKSNKLRLMLCLKNEFDVPKAMLDQEIDRQRQLMLNRFFSSSLVCRS